MEAVCSDPRLLKFARVVGSRHRVAPSGYRHAVPGCWRYSTVGTGGATVAGGRAHGARTSGQHRRRSNAIDCCTGGHSGRRSLVVVRLRLLIVDNCGACPLLTPAAAAAATDQRREQQKQHDPAADSNDDHTAGETTLAGPVLVKETMILRSCLQKFPRQADGLLDS